MKNGEKQYSLRGLNSVFFGLLLALLTSIIGSAAKSVVSMYFNDKTYDMYINAGIIVIGGFLSWILIVAGLSAVKDVSKKFIKARKYYIIELVGLLVEIGLITLVAYIMGFNNIFTNNGINVGTKVMAIIGVAIVVTLILWIISLLSVKNLLGGCADVAMEHEDKPYSRKCTRLWVEYILLNIVMVAGSISIIFFAYKVIQRIGGMENSINNLEGVKGLQEILGIGAAQIYGVIALIVILSILSFVLQILVMVRVRGTYTRFHNEPIKVEQKPSKSETKSETNGKLAELHPFAKKVPEGETSPLDTIQSGGTLPKAKETKILDKSAINDGIAGNIDVATDKFPKEDASAKAIDNLFAEVLKKEEGISNKTDGEATTDIDATPLDEKAED